MNYVDISCPRCGKKEFIQDMGDHFICTNPNCTNYGDPEDLLPIVEFQIIEDEVKHFPYNQIFPDRDKSEFYRKPYLEIRNQGNESTGR